jgi:hypothetical protein
MNDLTFQYPSWFLILCILLGLLYTAILYFRDRSFKDAPRWLPPGLALLRFLAVTLISILLLTPLLKRLKTDTKKPIVVLAQDQSQSIAQAMDSTALTDFQLRWQDLYQTLSEDYEVVDYAFGGDVRLRSEDSLNDQATNLSQLFQNIYDRYSNQNLGAVIIATDGIYNQGNNPVYAGQTFNAPVYTVGLGDTIPRKDLVLKRVFHNNIAYLGDRFGIQLDLSAYNCGGANTELRVYKVTNGRSQLLQSETISIEGADFFDTRELLLEANQVGVQRYRVSLSPVAGEVTTANNARDFFIDVLDARQKILLLANSPHPDLTALKQSLLGNKNYEVEVAYIRDLSVIPEEYDLVILHQLPARGQAIQPLLRRLNEEKVSRLFVLGTQSDFNQVGKAQDLLGLTITGQNTNDIQAKPAPEFNLFTLDERLARELPTFPPLLAPFGEFVPLANAQPLLYQRIGKIDTEYPLLVLGETQGIKTGVLAAEGIWKWRLFDFLQNENHDLFDQLIRKTVQYLSLKEDKRRFRVSLPKNIFNENEPVYLDAELYNQSFELINDPDVSIVITDQDNREFPYVFSKTTNAYRLNAGILGVGEYRFRAKVVTAGKELTYDGQFSVRPVQLESYDLTADHGLLRLLSERYGGEFLLPANLNGIPNQLVERGTVKPVVYQTTQTQSAINLRWIFALLAGLLFLEWFLRRYFGGY